MLEWHYMNQSVSQELKLLRSLAISIVGEDSEGSYRPEYVRRLCFVLFRVCSDEVYSRSVRRRACFHDYLCRA